jgi:hypothetical protein
MADALARKEGGEDTYSMVIKLVHVMRGDAGDSPNTRHLSFHLDPAQRPTAMAHLRQKIEEKEESPVLGAAFGMEPERPSVPSHPRGQSTPRER